jgi:hypothetical protein
LSRICLERVTNCLYFFCVVPVSSLVPYTAIPYLTSSLKANNQKVSRFDLNIEAFNLSLFHQGFIIKIGEILRNSNHRVNTKWARVPDAYLYLTVQEKQKIFKEIMLEETSYQLSYPHSNLSSGCIISKELRLAIMSDVWKTCNNWFLEVVNDF